jgi:hypothetical protein
MPRGGAASPRRVQRRPLGHLTVAPGRAGFPPNSLQGSGQNRRGRVTSATGVWQRFETKWAIRLPPPGATMVRASSPPAPRCESAAKAHLETRRNNDRKDPSPEPDVSSLDQPPLNPPEDQAHGAGDQIPGDSDRLNFIDGDKRVHAVHGDMTYAIDERAADEQVRDIDAVVRLGVKSVQSQ